VLPVDLYGAPSRGFYQLVVFERLVYIAGADFSVDRVGVDRFGFGPVCVYCIGAALLGLWALQVSLSAKRSQKLVHHPSVLGSIPP